MRAPWSLLCPTDFSPTSRGALHYAVALARRFGAALTVMTVDDPLLAELGDLRMGAGWSHASAERELRAFVAEAAGAGGPLEIDYERRVGKPATEILSAARHRGCQLIVMGTHGRRGVGKLLFGTTAERVLRETTVPILLTPDDPGPLPFDELARRASPMLVPVDFGPATAHQVDIARRLADTLRLQLIIGHVVEPVTAFVPPGIDASEVMSERFRSACHGLKALSLAGGMTLRPEVLIETGDPSEQIAAWIREKHAGLLVMALHDGAAGAPRMGSVTYRAVAASRILTLALPPALPPVRP
jgi:nucleotide-binding universal stress UspA family protein